MTTTARWHCWLHGLDKLLAVPAVLLLVAVGTEVHGWESRQAADLAGLLLALFMVPWIGVVTLAALVLIQVILAVRTTRTCR
ncbi:MAG: hypothetical protein ACREI3_11825 [Nitrospirales bacterium]